MVTDPAILMLDRTLVSGFIILLLGFSGLSTIPLLVVLILLLLTPVLYGVMVWIKLLGAG